MAYDRVVGVAICSCRRLFRDALAACLTDRPGFTVVGHVGEPADLLELCGLRPPDLVLFDAGAALASALAALRELRTGFDRARVVVVYEHVTPAELDAAWRLGLDTLVPCSRGLDALLTVLHECAEGVVADPARAGRMAGMTDHEREIIALLAGGHTAHQVADLLGSSVGAVENSKRRIYHKLQAVSQSHAIARAAALGLIGSPPPVKPAYERPEGVVLALLRGPDGPLRDRLVVSLLASRMPFVVDNGRRDERGPWDRSYTGPVLLLLVDPEPSDWDDIENLDIPVLLVTSRPVTRGETVRTFARGLVGIMTPERLEEVLAPALSMVASGYLVVAARPAAKVSMLIRARSGEANEGLPALTVRESEILRSIVAGDTVRQTARALGIAEKTVENTQARLFRKLGVRNRASAAAMAHTLGVLGSVTSGRA